MANDVHQLTIAGLCGGEFWETVQHYACDATSSADPVSDSASLITGFRANVETELLACMATATNIYGYKAKRVNNGGGPTVLVPIVAVDGAQDEDQLPASNGYCITSRYSNGTEWRAGRWFIPGIPESFVDQNQFNASAIAAIADLVIANSGFTSTPRTWAYGTWAGSVSTFFPPVYVNLSPKVGVQRRRLLPVL